MRLLILQNRFCLNKLRKLQAYGNCALLDYYAACNGCPETSVINYHRSLRNNPEECGYHVLRSVCVKRNYIWMFMVKELMRSIWLCFSVIYNLYCVPYCYGMYTFITYEKADIFTLLKKQIKSLRQLSRQEVLQRLSKLLIRNILIIVQRDATQSSLFIILQVHSTCFGCQTHSSWGIHKTVTTAFGTGH